LPILYPSTNVYKADLWIKVLNDGVPKARIPLHRQHASSNITYFGSMLRPDSSFRETDAHEIVFECPFASEFVRDYLATLYDPAMTITHENCVAFFWIADFMNDSVALPECEAFLRNNIQADILFGILHITDRFDDVCAKFLTSELLKDDTIAIKIKQMRKARFKWILNNCQQHSSDLRLTLLDYWLDGQRDGEGIDMILENNFTELATDRKVEFYRKYKDRMSRELDTVIFDHIFEKREKGISPKRESIDDTYVMISKGDLALSLTGVDTPDDLMGDEGTKAKTVPLTVWEIKS